MAAYFPLIFLLLGLIVGALSTWLIAKYKFVNQSNAALTADEIKKNYVLKEVLEQLKEELVFYKNEIKNKEIELRESEKENGANAQLLINLQERNAERDQLFEELRRRSQIQFENIANKLLEENGQKFSLQNQQQLKEVLHPLKEKIREFEQDMDKRFLEEAKDKVSLKKEIEQLNSLNQQLSKDANNLVNALKGESKTQGDWGEYRLEVLLEKSGLVKDIHFRIQPSFKDENGSDKRPDFIINLPESKHLVIDSKVSLIAYERYFHAESEEEKIVHLKSHIDSLRSHIKDLSSKNYQNLYQINSPDYLLLFVPIEPAFTTAVQEESQLFLDALDKNIVMVSTSTLLATMRTVSYIWRQEKQKTSVLEIARQSGMLYDKFVNFVEDLKGIGTKLDAANNSYQDAMNKLVDSRKFGDTLVGRAQKIKELGAKTSKSIPPELLNLVEDRPSPAENGVNQKLKTKTTEGNDDFDI